MVPAKENPREVARVKSELTDNARLNYAGELGAKKRRLLKDPSLTPDAKMIKLLPVSKALARETRRIRQFKVPDTETEEEEKELVTPAMENWMRRMLPIFGQQTQWQKRLEALNRGFMAGQMEMEEKQKQKPPIPPKPKKLQFDTPMATPLSPKPGPSWREPRPFKAKDLVGAIEALKHTPVGKGKGKGKGKSPLESAMESAIASKFASSKGGDTDEEESVEDEPFEDESDEDDDWLGRLRPRPTRAPKKWEEW